MREIQHLSRLYVAWSFVCAEETKLKSAENLQGMQDNIAKMQASMEENESKLQELSDQIKELQKKKDQVHCWDVGLELRHQLSNILYYNLHFFVQNKMFCILSSNCNKKQDILSHAAAVHVHMHP